MEEKPLSVSSVGVGDGMCSRAPSGDGRDSARESGCVWRWLSVTNMSNEIYTGALSLGPKECATHGHTGTLFVG